MLLRKMMKLCINDFLDLKLPFDSFLVLKGFRLESNTLGLLVFLKFDEVLLLRS